MWRNKTIFKVWESLFISLFCKLIIKLFHLILKSIFFLPTINLFFSINYLCIFFTYYPYISPFFLSFSGQDSRSFEQFMLGLRTFTWSSETYHIYGYGHQISVRLCLSFCQLFIRSWSHAVQHLVYNHQTSAIPVHNPRYVGTQFR